MTNMVSGLFRGHAITGPSQRAIDRALDEFAEYLSRDLYSLPEIARRMRITGGTACVLWRILCERYGERAS